MRTLTTVGIVLALAGCGGALDAQDDASGGTDAFHQAEATTGGSRPIVGTLRMRERDVVLTTESLEARGNESLREMTASATGEPVIADVDTQFQREALPDLSRIQADL